MELPKKEAAKNAVCYLVGVNGINNNIKVGVSGTTVTLSGNVSSCYQILSQPYAIMYSEKKSGRLDNGQKSYKNEHPKIIEMKTKTEWEQDILNITTTINQEFPELSKYINEMPLHNSGNEEMSVKSLEDYFHSLEELVGKYSKTHIGKITAKKAR